MTLTRTRRLSALVAPALLVLSLSACGGGAPTDASEEEFCEVYNAEPDLDEGIADAEPAEQAEAFVDASQKLADDFEEVGTPEGIPEDAREGFEISIDAARDFDQDEVQTALEEEDEDFFTSAFEGDDLEKVEAFEEYASETCG